MKIRNNFLERIVIVILLILLAVVANPLMLWMPSALLMIVITLITALVFLWAGFVLTEKGGDEREEIHRTNAGRAAYLAAAGTLTIALVYQGSTHSIDLWIPATLAVVILAKFLTRVYEDTYR
jgi:hypothetical protein